VAPEQAKPPLVLSNLVTSPGDVSRVKRELTALEEYMQMQRLREPGTPIDRLPKMSRMLDDLAQVNAINLLHESARRELEQFIDDLAARAPVVHLSFAADPSSASLQKLVLWLRQNIGPNVLVNVGLQPNIVAGCVMRTTNRYFDFSLKHYLTERRNFLVEALKPAQPSEEPAR